MKNTLKKHRLLPASIILTRRRLKAVSTSLSLLLISGLAANAATLAYNSNDLIIGFRAVAGTTGDDKVYLLDIGQYSKFSTALTLNTTNTPGLGNFATDLSSQFGSNWQTSGNVLWGIFGANTISANPPLYASEFRSSTATQSAPWGTQTAASRTNIRTNMNDGLSGYAGGTSTTNSNLGYFQSSSLANGYYDQVNGQSNDFKETDWTSIEATTSGLLDLYRVTSSAATTPGYFQIDGVGNIVFNAVPEPSTYVLMVLGGIVVYHTGRRRKRHAVIQPQS